MRVLTVCVGNICRSPLAQILLMQRLETAVEGGFLTVGSAGVHGLVGHSMEPSAADELVRLGGDPAGFTARRLTAELAGEADLILTMTREVRAEVLKEQPRAMKRTFTLLEFAALCRYAIEQDAAVYSVDDLLSFAARHRSHVAGVEQDIADPMGKSAAVHREVADQIAGGVHVVAALLAPLLRD